MLLRAVRTEAGERLPELPEDLSRLEEAICSVGARLVVVDPLTAFLGGDVNAHRDQDVRRALAPLSKLTERTGVAVILVRHLNKSGIGSNPLYRGGGSIGIIGAARSGLLAARDPDDEARRVLAITKANLALPPPALGYRMVETENHAVAVEWLGTTTHTAAALLAIPANADERSALDEAVTVLRQILLPDSSKPPTPTLSREVRRQAREAGIADRTLERAKGKLKVRSGKATFEGPWLWCLPCSKCHSWSKNAKEAPSTPRPGVGVLRPSWRPSEGPPEDDGWEEAP